MIMVQKPIHLLSSPTIHHRRLSSAPSAVVVQPTRTPGLLSLSKPVPTRSQPRQQQQQIRQPRAAKAKGPAPAANPRTSASPVAHAEPVKDSALSKNAAVATVKDVPSPKNKTSASATPNDKDNNSKSSRGRQRAKAAKEKAALPRSPSRSSTRGGARRRQSHHQGSPPLPSPIASQAESKQNADRSQSLHARSGNQFDPFLATSSDSESDNARSTSPAVVQKPSAELKLASRPSGKLARRRQPQLAELPTTPTPSKAVSVPRAQGRARDAACTQLSRSAPGSAAAGSLRGRPMTSDMFPICDDMTDVDDDEFAPSTPTRSQATTWQQGLFDDGPRTAPLSSKFVGGTLFPRATTPTPVRRRPGHIRSPSEGVFNMSFDEDTSSSSSSSSSGADEIKALVGLIPRRRMLSTTSTPPSNKRGAGIRPPNFFAASTFQNSPSPDDLPAPLF